LGGKLGVCVKNILLKLLLLPGALARQVLNLQ